jgi:hypothetical protein
VTLELSAAFNAAPLRRRNTSRLVVGGDLLGIVGPSAALILVHDSPLSLLAFRRQRRDRSESPDSE